MMAGALACDELWIRLATMPVATNGMRPVGRVQMRKCKYALKDWTYAIVGYLQRWIAAQFSTTQLGRQASIASVPRAYHAGIVSISHGYQYRSGQSALAVSRGLLVR